MRSIRKEIYFDVPENSEELNWNFQFISNDRVKAVIYETTEDDGKTFLNGFINFNVLESEGILGRSEFKKEFFKFLDKVGVNTDFI